MKFDNKPCIITFSHYGSLYGANRSLLSLIFALKDEINWIVIGCQAGDFSEELKRNNIRFYLVPFRLDVIPFSMPLTSRITQAISRNAVNMVLLPYLMHLARRHSPTVIHSNSSVFTMGSIVAYFLKIPHIWHIRGKPTYPHMFS